MAPPPLAELDHIAIVVASPDDAVDFYRRILGAPADAFTAEDGRLRRAIRIGGIKINLVEEGSRLPPGLHAPVRGSGHFCVMTYAPLSEWRDHLQAQGVMLEAENLRRTGLRGPMTSLFFRDLDRNLVEIARYE